MWFVWNKDFRGGADLGQARVCVCVQSLPERELLMHACARVHSTFVECLLCIGDASSSLQHLVSVNLHTVI